MLDSSSAGSFSSWQIEFKWDLIERIKRNAKDWEVDKGKESGINLEYDCVKSFVETDVFHELSAKYGLDSDIVSNFCKSFAAHVDLPKDKWFKYHEPIKDICDEPIIANTEVQSFVVNPVVPTAYIEKPPFPVRIKEHSKAATMIHKSCNKAPYHSEHIKVEPSIAMVKDLLVENIDGHVIYFCEDAARIAKPVRNEQDKRDKNKRVVGMPVVSVKIGDHRYHGLCDIGASISAIPFSLYQEVMHDISPVEIEEIDVTIKLANRDMITHKYRGSVVALSINKSVEPNEELKVELIFSQVLSTTDTTLHTLGLLYLEQEIKLLCVNKKIALQDNKRTVVNKEQ